MSASPGGAPAALHPHGAAEPVEGVAPPLAAAEGGGFAPLSDFAPAPSGRESGRSRQRRQRRAQAVGSPLYELKIEAAAELGLTEKVRQLGWGGLSAAEAGRVGGYVTRALRERAGSHDDGGTAAPSPPRA